MKRVVIFNILFLRVLILMGQAGETDSLLNLLNHVDDRDKAEIYYRLSQTTIWSWPDSTIRFAEKGLEYADQYEQTETKIDLLFSLSTALAEKGNFSMGLESAFELLAIAEDLKDPGQIAYAKSIVGSIYFYARDYQASLPYYLEVKEYPQEYERQKWLYSGFIGETYYHLDELDSAHKYLQISMENMPDDYRWPVAYLYLGKILERQGRLTEAVAYYKESMRDQPPIADYIKGYLAIANVFSITNKKDSAIHYANLAYEYASRTSFALFTQEALTLLKENYQSLNKLDSAFYYQELLLAVNEELFSRDKLVQLQNVTYEQEKRQEALLKDKEDLNRRIVTYALAGGIVIILIIVLILYRNNKFKQRAYDLLQRQKADIDTQKMKVEQTLEELRVTQSQLIHSEKMASLGELTAGIAHEIQNPLNFVNNFSDVNKELALELLEEVKNGKRHEAEAIIKDIIDNEEKILHHGKRADAIVKGMLQHSRAGGGEKEPTDINALCDEYLRLSYHGLRAKDKSFNAEFKTELDPKLPKVNVVPQDIGRVLLNLINNAFYAVSEKQKTGDAEYKPTVIVSTNNLGKEIQIKVSDNGMGIPEQVRDKIFQPFFTTKATGEGTGLGLSMSYDIVTKGHGGTIDFSSDSINTEFIINLKV